MKRINELILKYRKLVSLLMHIGMISISYILAFYFRFDFKLPEEYRSLIVRTMPFVLLIKVSFFYYFGLFFGLWRYVSMGDLWRILKANVISTAIFVVFIVFVEGLRGFPRSIFILDWGLCVGFVSGIRFFSRMFRERIIPIRCSKRLKALIIGAGQAGIMVLMELKRNMNYDIVGFMDDDPAKIGMNIHGKKIFGGKDQIKDISEKYGVEEIIIAMPSVKGETIREVIACCQIQGVRIKIVPGMYKILSGEMEVKLRDVQPEDLLGRESVEIDEKEIGRYIRNKIVLITGAGGSIGSEISRQVSVYSPKQLILLDYNENDIYFLERELKRDISADKIMTVTADFKDYSTLKYVFSRFRPQIVFHAAAFKHVPLMEKNPASAVKNNVIGTRNIMYASEHYGAESFVLISSDKAVNPTSIMGATKRIAEMVLQAKSWKKCRTKFIAVRFGNVLGSKGSVVPLFKKQIEEDLKVTVTHPDAKRYFMSIREAVQLVLQASALGSGGEIFVLDMGEQIKIVDLAKALIRLSGLRPSEDIPIEFIGLRPGEKLFEETLHRTEEDEGTKNERIFIGKPDNFDIKKLNRQIKELERLSILMKNAEIVKKIAEIVPTYKPSA